MATSMKTLGLVVVMVEEARRISKNGKLAFATAARD